jgi:hypothetical protein
VGWFLYKTGKNIIRRCAVIPVTKSGGFLSQVL